MIAATTTAATTSTLVSDKKCNFSSWLNSYT
jgi:hypothetical protein